MHVAVFPLILVAAYFLGSFPTGYLMAKARGIDIRQAGSGNIGATNAFRILGKGPGTLVLLIDAAKGALACIALPMLAKAWVGSTTDATMATDEWLAILAGVGAVLGHNYTCWLGFKGGKGIATSAGVLGALAPVPLAGVLGVFLLVVVITRYVSLGSILAAAALPIAVLMTGGSGRLLGVCGVLSALAIYKHRANIGRLLAGTESRIGNKRVEGSK